VTHGWDGTRPAVAERNIWGEPVKSARPAAGTAMRGSLLYVEPGVELWSRQRGRRGIAVDGRPEDPLGGVLLSVGQRLDVETGEIHRTYRCLDPIGRDLTYAVLDEAEIGESAVQPASSARCTRLLRRLCEAIAYTDAGKRRSGGPHDSQHSRWLHDAMILDRVLLPGAELGA